MTTFKLTPTQKREILKCIVTYKVCVHEDIIPYVGRNLGDFDYLDLLEQFSSTVTFPTDIKDLYTAVKNKVQHTPSVSWTKTKIKKYSKLTDMEEQVFDFLLDELEGWIGAEGYSPVGTQDIVEGTGIEAEKLRGVLSSLTKKNIIHGWEADVTDKVFYTDAEIVWETIWSFVDQMDLSKEDLIAKVS